MALLDLGRLLHCTPSDLSGSEEQHVTAGRVLLACSKLLLMDEPLTRPDRGKQEEIMACIEAIPEWFSVSVPYVIHSDTERHFLADCVLNLEDDKPTGYWTRGDCRTGRNCSETMDSDAGHIGPKRRTGLDRDDRDHGGGL